MSCPKSQYSIETLAQIIWLHKYSGSNLMALAFAAYFDSSGKDRYPVLTVAGAVSPVKKWARFEKQWSGILKREGVTEFHATDFASSQGEYKLWRDDKVRRKKFLSDLIAAIRTNVNKLFSVSIELEAWQRIDSEYYFSERFYSPYALAGFAVIDQTLKWAKRKGVKPPQFIFEDGDDGWEGLLKLCKWDKIIPARLPKALAIPCQIGDMLAWKSRITATNSLGLLRKMESTGNYDLESVLSLQNELASLTRLQVRPGMANVFAYETMLRTCQKNQIPKRSRPLTSV